MLLRALRIVFDRNAATARSSDRRRDGVPMRANQAQPRRSRFPKTNGDVLLQKPNNLWHTAFQRKALRELARLSDVCQNLCNFSFLFREVQFDEAAVWPHRSQT
jgi:hypothetical protein